MAARVPHDYTREAFLVGPQIDRRQAVFMRYFLVDTLCVLTAIVLPFAAVEGADSKRILPPAGIEIPKERREALTAETAQLKLRLASLRPKLGAAQRDLLPDVEILLKSVDFALCGGEFYHARQLDWADAQLKLASDRLDSLAAGEAPWTSQPGLVVRGFRSRLDDSPQPYGLVIPDELDLSKPNPLYVWLHGRGDTTLDPQFIQQRMTSPGQIQPAGAMVLHPFGRYCNGYKSAGEVDVFEAIEATCREYKVDRERIVLCGFSMGGAGVWHLGAHYPDRWAAMSPGAGFVDVRRYQGLSDDDLPAWYEQALWGVYDVPDYARNLLNLPLVAYSGELDKQKQAADLMEAALLQEGLVMTHIVGPGVAHKYEPKAFSEVLARLHAFEQQGVEHHPEAVHVQTRTLRYPRCHWIELQGLAEHWRDARVDAVRRSNDRVELATSNVTRLRLNCPWPEQPGTTASVVIDDQTVEVEPGTWTDGVELVRHSAGWQLADESIDNSDQLAKTPGLQGPIDDAFVEPFLVVRPTGKSDHPAVADWVAAEQKRFRERWRTLFRGEVREIDDCDLTEEQIGKYNLLLWGDATSNSVVARIAQQLPIAWDDTAIQTPDGREWTSSSHALILVYPNPLPSGRGRYIVLNSGMTFREAHDRTNSLQNPKLPDWAVLDLATPANDHSAGRVVDAAFFDEAWQYQRRRSIEGDSAP